MIVARLRLAPVGETMSPPRAPFFRLGHGVLTAGLPAGEAGLRHHSAARPGLLTLEKR